MFSVLRSAKKAGLYWAISYTVAPWGLDEIHTNIHTYNTFE